MRRSAAAAAAAAPLAVAVLGSLALSLTAVWQDPVINRDGVLYLLAARQLVAGDWLAALALHPLPGYPLLLAGASVLPGLGAEAAAHGLNAVLSAVLAGSCSLLPINTSNGLGLTHLTFYPLTGRISTNLLADLLLIALNQGLVITRLIMKT